MQVKKLFDAIRIYICERHTFCLSALLTKPAQPIPELVEYESYSGYLDIPGLFQTFCKRDLLLWRALFLWAFQPY